MKNIIATSELDELFFNSTHVHSTSDVVTKHTLLIRPTFMRDRLLDERDAKALGRRTRTDDGRAFFFWVMYGYAFYVEFIDDSEHTTTAMIHTDYDYPAMAMSMIRKFLDALAGDIVNANIGTSMEPKVTDKVWTSSRLSDVGSALVSAYFGPYARVAISPGSSKTGYILIKDTEKLSVMTFETFWTREVPAIRGMASIANEVTDIILASKMN